jgi:hypothetical protein
VDTDRKGYSAREKLAERKLDDREVRAMLDEMDVDEVIATLGDPYVDTHYASAPGWLPGSPRPALADEDPAVMQAIGRCAASRIRNDLPRSVLGGVHPKPCGWCSYPVPELLAACSWSVWWSRTIVSETLTWTGDGHYTRSGRHDVATNPAVARFWNLLPRDRGALVADAIERSRS